ncbi:MAG: DUF1211 domain-containing protein [Asticcacaulis sp.]|nr:DUF1211 domain-containing protein [Asticcacaulis sp.]
MSHHESNARGPDARMVDRMLFFSDAVFAIVLTIMVLEMHAPVMEGMAAGEQSAAALWHAIIGMSRVLFALVISFILVGMWWTVHMRVTRNLHYFDWPSAVLNLLFLFCVMITPFAASVLVENITNPTAWQVYWGVNAASSIALTLLMLTVSRDGGRLVGGMNGRERTARALQAFGPGMAFSIGVYLAGSGHMELARWCWVFIFPVMMVARMVFHKKKEPKAEAEAPADA